jgi:hypothetical protein
MPSEKLEQILRLKALFDNASPELRKDYWNQDVLEAYSESLGERIRWKWNSFLQDLILKKIGLEQLFGTATFVIHDWGCGPGNASLAVAESLEQKNKFTFRFEDRSPLAVAFSENRMRIYLGTISQSETPEPRLKVLLISYVLSELDALAETSLLNKISEFDILLWLDSGSHRESRRLAQIRNQLTSNFLFLAPCPHQKKCPLSEENNPRDWCHRFAKTPAEVFHSAYWSDVAKVFNIDLRSLPYSSLYAVKKNVAESSALLRSFSSQDQQLGRPRIGKAEATLDFCTVDGLYEQKKVSKRHEPEHFKRLKKLF